MRNKIQEIIAYFAKRLNLKRSDLGSFAVFALIVVCVALLLSSIFSNIAPALFVVSFSILFLVTWFMAGVVVFKSLFVISGGLSLMIFLAQAYCAPEVAHTANSSMQSVFGFSLIYLAFLFIKSLYVEVMGGKDGEKEIRGHLKTLKEIYKGKTPWVILILYASSLGIFLWQLYEIFTPIFRSLCIYK